jgi:hypothetical protein
MTKEQLREVEPGITVRTVSFEKLVQELAEDYLLYMLEKKALPSEKSSLLIILVFYSPIIFQCLKRALIA